MSTTIARLLAQKRELLERLEQNSAPNEQAEIEAMLEKIDTALDMLADNGHGDPSQR